MKRKKHDQFKGSKILTFFLTFNNSFSWYFLISTITDYMVQGAREKEMKRMPQSPLS
jgi:hypothetical protein